MNQYDRVAYSKQEIDGKKIYNTNFSTFLEQLTKGKWSIDNDSFEVNQFGHPYQGSVYFGFARSAGLNYYQSSLYSNIGSYIWETGGETTHPSLNDQIASGIGGSFIGEALFRMANLFLEHSDGKPKIFKELCAAAISPSLGFNRIAYKDRFKTIFPSNEPAMFYSLSLGIGWNAPLKDSITTNPFKKYEGTAIFTLSYGLPGKKDYTFKRPFDYFHFEYAALSNKKNPIDNVMIHGLLVGNKYESKNLLNGIWGLYGSYNYISLHIFRVSSTSLSFGTTFQLRLKSTFSIQGSGLIGLGFVAAGSQIKVQDRDYEYGLSPQGLIRLRLVCGKIAMVDFTGRSFYLKNKNNTILGKNVDRHYINFKITFLVHKRHCIGFGSTAFTKDGRNPYNEKLEKKTKTISIFYSLLGNSKFGIVK